MDQSLGEQKTKLKPVATVVTSLTGDKVQVNPDGTTQVLEQTLNLSSAPVTVSKSAWQGPVKPVAIPPRYVVVTGDKTFRRVARTQSNHVILIKDSHDCQFQISMNQKFGKLILVNCVNCNIQVLDSAVLTTKCCEMVNCKDCVISFDACDCSELYFYECDGIKLQVTNEETMVEDFYMRWKKCKNCSVQIIRTTPGTDPNMVMMIPFDVLRSFDVPLSESPEHLTTKLWFPLSYPRSIGDGTNDAPTSTAAPSDSASSSSSSSSSSSTSSASVSKNYSDLTAECSRLIVVSDPLGASAVSRTKEDLLKEIEQGIANNSVFDTITNDTLGKLYGQELEEFEEPLDLLKQHVKTIADAIRNANHVVVYTGAGISTSASIPDYRGPEGAWTLRDKGGKRTKETKELSDAWPTTAHYALTHLLQKGIIHYITSTNLDGLHRRSGTPQNKIVELHGNCYREVCGDCEREYLRSFDVLHTRLARWTHLTGRSCGTCGGGLKDTIAHFTENLAPNEWKKAVQNARKCDVALVLGTSMNVQPAASLPVKALANENGKMFIVNLQRTPYDHLATQKIYAKTDIFMDLLMQELGHTTFDTSYDHCAVLAQIEEEEEKKKKIQRTRTITGALIGVVAVAAVVLTFVVRKQ